jgi:hypothetical protein
MATIAIPDELLKQVAAIRPESVSTEEFVADAVRTKLAWQSRRAEFFRLSDETRQAMQKKGLSETELLADFEGFRQGLTDD